MLWSLFMETIPNTCLHYLFTLLVYICCIAVLTVDLYIWACAHVLSILDRETIIMHRLQAVILEHTNILLDTVELAAELDWCGYGKGEGPM